MSVKWDYRGSGRDGFGRFTLFTAAPYQAFGVENQNLGQDINPCGGPSVGPETVSVLIVLKGEDTDPAAPAAKGDFAKPPARIPEQLPGLLQERFLVLLALRLLAQGVPIPVINGYVVPYTYA